LKSKNGLTDASHVSLASQTLYLTVMGKGSQLGGQFKS